MSDVDVVGVVWVILDSTGDCNERGDTCNILDGMVSTILPLAFQLSQQNSYSYS
jgi:hypothetical protein